MTTKTVTDDTALQISSAFACIRRTAETMASLPIQFFSIKRDASGRIVSKKIVTDHPLYRLLRWQPNRYQTRSEFFETIYYQLGFRGNAYCLIERDSSGKDIISLLPLMTSQVETVLNSDGSVIHKYYSSGKINTYTSKNIWHLKLLGNGIVGLSPLDQARNSLGISLGAEESVNRLSNSGFKQGGVLTIDKILSPDQRGKLKANFNDITSGKEEALKVLEAGMKFTPTSMLPKDVQLLESRKFQLEDICRFFDVPPVLIHDMSSSTVWGSGITEIVRGWYKLGLAPYREKMKDSIQTQLLDISERETVEPDFDIDELLRGGEKERYEGYQIAIRSGVMTPNECRGQEGLPPDSAGDKLFIDQQLVYLENGGNKNETKTFTVKN
ncbi:MAG: phage portal protein [Candidatus Omnitrophica bacterium]|nr:phage portal protein [Candidatus Omnitrophota bacterium]